MTIKEAQEKITKAGGSVETFNKWMSGQTCGLKEDGTVDIYEYDVDRFIRYKCNSKNEPFWDFD